MNAAAWYWITAGLSLCGALAAVAARALDDFSRHVLQEVCQRRGVPDRFGVIVLNHKPAAMAAECLRTVAIFAAGGAFARALLKYGEPALGFAELVGIAVAAVAAMAVIAILIPWAIARHWSEAYLAATWPLWNFNRALMSPLLGCAGLLGDLALRIAGRPPTKASEESVEDEIRTIVSEGHREGLLEEDAREMIEGVMELKEVEVSQIMTPRTYMFSIDLQTPWDEMLRAVIEAGHTRVPVYSRSRDNIVGLMHTRDLLRELAQPEDRRQPLANLLRKPVFVPETKAVDDMLQEFQGTHNHIALVLDEFGGFSGLVTIEDVLEEIVGEIADEHDDAHVDDIKQVGENHYQVAARVRIEELNERLGLSLPEDADFDTLGGFVFHEIGHIPAAGEELVRPEARIVVLDATRRRIDRLALYVTPSEQAAEEK